MMIHQIKDQQLSDLHRRRSSLTLASIVSLLNKIHHLIMHRCLFPLLSLYLQMGLIHFLAMMSASAQNDTESCLAHLVLAYYTEGQPLLVSMPSTNSISLLSRADHFKTADYLMELLNNHHHTSLRVFNSNSTSTRNNNFRLYNFEELPKGNIIFLWCDGENDDHLEMLMTVVGNAAETLSLNFTAQFLIIAYNFPPESPQELAFSILEYLYTNLNIYNVVVLTVSQSDANTEIQSSILDKKLPPPKLELFTWFPLHIRQSPTFDDIIFLGECSSNDSPLHKLALYPNAIPKSFFGKKVKVSAVIQEPVSWFKGTSIDQDNETQYLISGQEIDLLMIVCNKLNLTVTFQKPIPSNEGIDKKVVATMLELMNGISDIAIGSIPLQSPFRVQFEHCGAVGYYLEKWFVPCPEQIPRIQRIAGIFQWTTSLLLCFVFALFVMSMWTAAVLTKETESTAFANIGCCFINIWLLYLGGSVKDVPKAFVLRMLFIICIWYAYAMSQLFQAFFTTYLVEPGYEKPISTFEELLNSSLELGFEESLSYYFKTHFLMDFIGLLRNRIHDCLNLENCLHRVINDRSYATASYESWVNYFVKLKYPSSHRVLCSLNDHVLTNQVTIFLSKASPYANSFNRIIQYAWDTGVINYLHERNEDSYRYATNTGDGGDGESSQDYFIFSLQHLKMSFFVLFLGCGLGFLALVFETILSYLKNRQVPSRLSYTTGLKSATQP
ncbi:Ionotropic receptor 664 [Blattella germanica]|nr:Ionotropic receptor 664 [Blattella germanica]